MSASLEDKPVAVDHVAAAIARLPAQFQPITGDTNNFVKLLTALVSSVQDVENAIIQLLALRSLSTATGAQLDAIGVIVAFERDGLSDDDYRRLLRAKIAADRSSGTPNELIRIAYLIMGLDPSNTGKVLIRCVSGASFILEIRDTPVTTTAQAAALQELLVLATSAGVRIVIVYSAHALAQTYRFDSGPGLDTGHLATGLDEDSTP